MQLRNWTCVLVQSLMLEIGNLVSVINVMKCLCFSIALNISWQIGNIDCFGSGRHTILNAGEMFILIA